MSWSRTVKIIYFELYTEHSTYKIYYYLYKHYYDKKEYWLILNNINILLNTDLYMLLNYLSNIFFRKNYNNNIFMAPFKTPKVTSQANKIKNKSHCIKQKHTTDSVHIQVKCSRDSIIQKACIKRYVLRRVLKVSKQLLLRISRGREFHRRGAA